MIAVKVTFEDGDHFTSSWNGNYEEARHYYLNKIFNIGFGPLDNMKKCISVEVV